MSYSEVEEGAADFVRDKKKRKRVKTQQDKRSKLKLR